MSILIKNGRVIDPKNSIDTNLDILITDGKISELNKNLDPKKAIQIIDASKKNSHARHHRPSIEFKRAW